jgi:hypothetical protein
MYYVRYFVIIWQLLDSEEWNIERLLDWYLTPTLAVFQLYFDLNKAY